MRRFRLLLTSAVTCVLAAFGVVASAHAATDYFLEINGVQGESQDVKFSKAVDVLSYSWGAAKPGSGVPQLQDFSISKRIDASSPVLFRRLVTGEHISSMELLGRKTGANPIVYLKYCFEDVTVSSLQQSDSRGSDNPVESVSFRYRAASLNYARQKADGSVSQNIFAGWNVTMGELIATYPAPCGF
jgi:type VI secretion system secreted protein Hcp